MIKVETIKDLAQQKKQQKRLTTMLSLDAALHEQLVTYQRAEGYERLGDAARALIAAGLSSSPQSALMRERRLDAYRHGRTHWYAAFGRFLEDYKRELGRIIDTNEPIVGMPDDGEGGAPWPDLKEE